MKINAVAGSGKTTTLIEYAARRTDRSILYLTYNRSVADEVKTKVAERGLRHVAVHTIHALAYRHTDAARLQLEHEISEWKLLERYVPAADRRGQTGLMLAWLLKDLVGYYLNSAHPGIDDELLQRYAQDTAPQARVLALLDRRGAELLGLVRALLGDMRGGAQPAVHDFYLKLFQFQRTPLPYDIILVDEAQDTSGVMLSVVERQPARKVFVGDTFQQIYGFRHAVNSLDRLAAPALPLSQTFRFGDELAKHVANQINDAYALLGEDGSVRIEGTRQPTLFGANAPAGARPLTLIARSNLGLFEACVEHLAQSGARFFFQGGYGSYSFLNARVMGAYFLSQGRRDKVRDPFLSRFAGFASLKDFAQQTQNQSLLSIVGLVERFGGTLFELDRQLKGRLGERHEADFIFTTTHKAKGQEYDHVEMLYSDFLTRADLRRTLRQKGSEADPLKLREEVNIYYVAATRAKRSIKLAPF